MIRTQVKIIAISLFAGLAAVIALDWLIQGALTRDHLFRDIVIVVGINLILRIAPLIATHGGE